MRSSSLARVVMASLGVSVVITLGCGGSPPSAPAGPSPLPSFSVRAISPSEGSSLGATIATITGTGFQAGATVTVDGSRVDATVLNANTITLAMPAHVAGRVGVTVIGPLSEAQDTVPGGYRYIGPPVISELRPNIGSTGGGTMVIIRGTDLWWSATTVTIDGIVSSVENGWPEDELYLSTPAHAAGTVEVIVTDRYGQTGSGVFTYASPTTFDFNGDWRGWAENLASWEFAHLWLTIRDNTVVSVSCGQRHDGAGAVSLPLDPRPVVANGGFSFAGSGGVSITGKIVSPNTASGSMSMPSCISVGQWRAEKKL